MQPLATRMAADLAAWARALGVADPVPHVGELLAESFDLPHQTEIYKQNELSPGTIPFEVSFSEAAPAALRIDVEPWPTKLPPELRRARLTERVVALAQPAFGAEGARRFSDASASWLAATHALRFGAFFGASFDARGLSDVRIYFEHTGKPESSPLSTALPGTLPIMESLTLSRTGTVSARTYLCFAFGHRMQDLGPLMRQLGLERRHEELCAVAEPLAGGEIIQPGQSIAGVRSVANGAELKLDVMVHPRRAAEVEQAVRRSLAARPGAEAYARWRDAIGPARISVFSVRVTAESGATLNIYTHPYAFGSAP